MTMHKSAPADDVRSAEDGAVFYSECQTYAGMLQKRRWSFRRRDFNSRNEMLSKNRSRMRLCDDNRAVGRGVGKAAMCGARMWGHVAGLKCEKGLGIAAM